MALQIIDIFAPVLLCILVGVSLAKLDAPFDRKSVSSLVVNVGYPALIISHLEGQHVGLGSLLGVMLAAAVVVAAFGFIGFVILRLLNLPPRAFLSPMMINNVGNVGIPVSAFAFGDEGLAYGLAFFVVVITANFTVGLWIPMGRVTFRDIATKPVIPAIVVALVLLATEARLPIAIDRTLSILGGFSIPLMLLTLGYSIARLDVGNVWRGATLAVLHLIMAAGVAFGVTQLFGFEGTVRNVFILQCMLPAAIATYLWAELYVPEWAADVASFIMASTLLAIIVLPAVVIFLAPVPGVAQ